MVLDFAKEALENASTHSINFDELRAGKANIKVFGVGGAGCNALNSMIFCAFSSLHRIPLRFILTSIKLLHVASTFPLPIGSLSSRAFAQFIRFPLLSKQVIASCTGHDSPTCTNSLPLLRNSPSIFPLYHHFFFSALAHFDTLSSRISLANSNIWI